MTGGISHHDAAPGGEHGRGLVRRIDRQRGARRRRDQLAALHCLTAQPGTLNLTGMSGCASHFTP